VGNAWASILWGKCERRVSYQAELLDERSQQFGFLWLAGSMDKMGVGKDPVEASVPNLTVLLRRQDSLRDLHSVEVDPDQGLLGNMASGDRQRRRFPHIRTVLLAMNHARIQGLNEKPRDWPVVDAARNRLDRRLDPRCRRQVIKLVVDRNARLRLENRFVC
jgi:hypothetical protein